MFLSVQINITFLIILYHPSICYDIIRYNSPYRVHNNQWAANTCPTGPLIVLCFFKAEDGSFTFVHSSQRASLNCHHVWSRLPRTRLQAGGHGEVWQVSPGRACSFIPCSLNNRGRRDHDVSLSFRAERSQAERLGFWRCRPEGVAGCIPRFCISST